MALITDIIQIFRIADLIILGTSIGIFSVLVLFARRS